NMQVFAPIAHRLGIKAIKDELEDRSLQYLDPIGYSEIENTLLMNEEGRDKFIEEIKAQLLAKTKDTIKNVFISGRVKSINSIYRKTFMRGQSIDQIFDVFAVRVIVDNVSDCYNVLGVVHDIFKPIPNRFKDYISMPKPNMYQSLHTTVLDKNAIPFEVQIRTWEMHYTAEYGIAAHWKYKLGMDKNGKVEDRLHKNIENVRKMILEQLQTEDATDIARNIRNDFEENDVYVFTPKGDVMSLPRGSTPIDLAYLIHTQVGHRMVGAKINNKIVSIDYKLRTGDICEILTQKEEHPNRAWIDICKTASAKSKIRQWFKHEKRDENIVEGKAMIEREFKRQGMNLTEEEYPEFFRSVSVKKQYNTLDDFYAAVGYGGIQLWKIMPRLREEYQKTYASDLESITVPPVPEKRSKASSGVIIEGNDDVLVKFSNCCNPLPGDEIIGYITRGYGVSIHKRTCTNVPKDISQSEEPERWVSCFWEEQVDEAFRSTLQITATDRSGLLADVTVKLSTMHINIHTLNSREVKNNKAVVTVTIDVMGRNHLRGVISRLSDINGIEEIKRL
ncbi:MAG: bifunctional (p)ppGpp synthetase/guanosine-3',5'-bis(diphosphate) 3'-pyrophosphohydrolase, partial [Ruminococcus sp.]|nr:bifunctional (p)ppGpp synthetase/guanosine-3',5'-bis(diphosphate) 3'-pyrophosphohydrolase [Ruminococcus sp.]